MKKQYGVAKRLTEIGFGVIAIGPVIDGKKGTGKVPSVRSNKFSNLDDIGNPIPMMDNDGRVVVNKYGKQDYAKEYGGSKNPILLGDDSERRLYKTFCDPSYTDRKVDQLNIGIVTGSATGVVVLDIDGKEGKEQLKLLTNKYGDLPKTLSASTGRDDGYHLYYKVPKVNGEYLKMGSKVKFLSPDIDYKGDNGYSIAPPSKHWRGKRYKWDIEVDDINIDNLPELPDWVVLLLIGDQWHSRDDGLFEAERDEYEATHKKKMVKATNKVITFPIGELGSYGSGFYCKRGDEFFHMDGSNDSHQELSCCLHNSQSGTSFHIDYKGDHWEWNCFGGCGGGRAYDPTEYAEYLRLEKYFNTDGLDKWIDKQAEIDEMFGDGLDDITIPKKVKTDVEPDKVVNSVGEDDIINMPDGIDDGITMEDFGKLLKDFIYKDKYVPSFLSDYIKGSDGGRREIRETILLGLLSNYAAMLGTNYKIMPNPKGTWEEPTLLWGASVGKSGFIKTGLKKIVDRPFKTVYDKMKKDDKKTSEIYNQKMAEYDKKFGLWKADKADKNMPSAPSKHNYPKNYNQQEDTTLASLQNDAEFCHRGLFLYADELMSVFDSFDALQKGGGSYFQKSLLKAYDSIDDYNLGRASKKVDIPRWHVGLYGFCVKDDLKANLLQKGNRKDGWSARFLVTVMPHGLVGNDYETDATADVGVLQNIFLSMYNVKPEYDKDVNGIKHKTLRFDDEAQAFWINFDKQRALLMNKCPELRRSFYESIFQKMIGQAARLSAIIHLIKYHKDSYANDELTVGIDSVRSGCYLAMMFHRNIFDLLFTTDDDELGETEKRVIKSCMTSQNDKGDFKRTTDLAKNLRIRAAEVKSACDSLVEKNIGNYVDGGKIFIVWNKN